MEANSNSFHLDSLYLPIKMSTFLEEPDNTSLPNCISQFYQTESNLQEFPVSMSSSHVTNKSNSSSVADKRENKEPITNSVDTKRNSEGSSSMTSAQSKVMKYFIHFHLSVLLSIFNLFKNIYIFHFLLQLFHSNYVVCLKPHN